MTGTQKEKRQLVVRGVGEGFKKKAKVLESGRVKLRTKGGARRWRPGDSGS